MKGKGQDYVSIPIGIFEIEGEDKGSSIPLLYCAFQMSNIRYAGHNGLYGVGYREYCFHLGYDLDERKKRKSVFNKDMLAFDRFNEIFGMKMTRKEYMTGRYKNIDNIFINPYDYIDVDNRGKYVAFVSRQAVENIFRSNEKNATKSKLLEYLVLMDKNTKKRKLDEDDEDKAKYVPEIYPAMMCNLEKLFGVSRKTAERAFFKLQELDAIKVRTHKFNIFTKEHEFFKQINLYLIVTRDKRRKRDDVNDNNVDENELKYADEWLNRKIEYYNSNYKFDEKSMTRIFTYIGIGKGKYCFREVL